jgi:hypothetical protein
MLKTQTSLSVALIVIVEIDCKEVLHVALFVGLTLIALYSDQLEDLGERIRCARRHGILGLGLKGRRFGPWGLGLCTSIYKKLREV